MGDEPKKAARDFQASIMEGFKPDPEWVEGFMDAGRRNYERLFGKNGERDPGLVEAAEDFEAHLKTGKLQAPEATPDEVWFTYKVTVQDREPLGQVIKELNRAGMALTKQRKLTQMSLLKAIPGLPNITLDDITVDHTRDGAKLMCGLIFSSSLNDEQWDQLLELFKRL